MPIDPRTVFATDIFFREARKQWIKQHPSADPYECPVKLLDEYHPMQRTAMVSCIAKAIEATTGMDDAYLAWINSKTASQSAS